MKRILSALSPTLLMFVVVAALGQSSTPPDGKEVEAWVAKTVRISLGEEQPPLTLRLRKRFRLGPTPPRIRTGSSPPMESESTISTGAVPAPTLILIHGLGDNPHLYDDFAPAFTDSFRVIAYAPRGEGDSEAKEPYDGVTLAEDLRGLMDTLGIRKAHLAGFSMGGNEITAIAGMHPERVDRIVYLDSAYIGVTLYGG